MRIRLPLAFALLLTGGVARASTYALDEIPTVVSAPEAAKLKSAGLATTDALLGAAGDAAARKALAKKTGFAVAKIQGWAEFCDLLRVKGIGPDVARQVIAAGVHNVAQLKVADPAKLEAEIAKVNAKDHLSENPPSAEHLKAWIAQAGSLAPAIK